MFSYEFMRYAFICGILIALIIPLVGQTCVLKRASMTGDALSHTALLGVAIGLIAGINPIWISIIVCIISSLIMEIIRKRFHKYSEMAVMIVMSFSIALAVILSKFSKTANFNSYLFGSILLVSIHEVIITSVLTLITLIFYVGFYHQIRYVVYNESQAKLDGINVDLINIVHTILISIVIAISSKIIGALMVSALMVIPYGTAIQITKNYKKTMLLSILFSLLSIISGLIVSYYFDLQPGGTIVVISVLLLIIVMITFSIIKRHSKKSVLN